MGVATCPQTNSKTVAEVRDYVVDFSNKLGPAETLTGTPTVTAAPATITIGSIAVNTSPVTTSGGNTVPTGKGIQFTLSVGAAATAYKLTVTSPSTSGTPSQVLQAYCNFEVEA